LDFSFEISTIDELSIPAKKISSLIENHSVFIFDGEMGVGKTTFIGVICELLKISSISSPTYSIVNNYYSPLVGEVYHFDCYRLKNEDEAIESGLEEILDSGSPCFIEWANKIQNLLPNKYVRVKIEQHNNIRNLIISI
jgi:tRNA threonylcarbamoyladenosine biosynthesis protein TsaE